MKSENFILIQGFMCNELGLKGNELLIYALIYGFSQDGVSCYSGGRQYIADTFNISLPTVDKALQGLLDKGYIIKHISGDYTKPDTYWVDLNMVVKKLYGGSKETLLNNIANNKKNSKTISKDIVDTTKYRTDDFIEMVNTTKSKKKNLFQQCVDLINDFTDDEELRGLLVEFLKICLENSRDSGQPFYKNTFKGKLNKLNGLSTDTQEQIKIVCQTLDNGWAGFYALKNDKPKKSGRYTVNEPTDMGYVVDRANKESKPNGAKF